MLRGTGLSQRSLGHPGSEVQILPSLTLPLKPQVRRPLRRGQGGQPQSPKRGRPWWVLTLLFALCPQCTNVWETIADGMSCMHTLYLCFKQTGHNTPKGKCGMLSAHWRRKVVSLPCPAAHRPFRGVLFS
uniref:Uncharacterized protein n=1 Tax=Myotis myotis TaxID=51298 RepID=A0A7J7UPE0_MYOMY|nr:hypothetical protein mMyoMyo1_008565 [Myotis myotis]